MSNGTPSYSLIFAKKSFFLPHRTCFSITIFRNSNARKQRKHQVKLEQHCRVKNFLNTLIKSFPA